LDRAGDRAAAVAVRRKAALNWAWNRVAG
jgi:hypothetical protein